MISQYEVLILDRRSGAFDILAQTDDPTLVEKLRETVAGVLPKPLDVKSSGVPLLQGIFIPQQSGRKGKKIIVTAIADDSPLQGQFEVGMAFSSASEMSLEMGYVYNACSMALTQAKRLKKVDQTGTKTLAATLQGVTFMTDKDHNQSLLEDVKID